MLRSGSPSGNGGNDVAHVSSQYLGHGMAFAAAVALFGWLGSWVGQRVEAESVLTLLGILFGGAAGLCNMYVQLVIRPRQVADTGKRGD
jgi:hypothetical protein